MCSFCNQKEITGQLAQPTAVDVKNAVETALKSKKCTNQNAEIAFFGGSFTAIDKTYMESLLQAAFPYIQAGKIKGIRISTRPDCIDENILNFLKCYGVTSIELGAQSMDNAVLSANNRGHSAQDVEYAVTLIKAHGFSCGLQMMVGLYKSTAEKDIETAKQFIRLAPDTVRIYPTIVMKDTKLEQLYYSGEYKVSTLEETVALCAKLLTLFSEANINVIRLGLHSSENLEQEHVAGPWHPAFSQLCQSHVLLNRMLHCIKEEKLKQGKIAIKVNPKTISTLIGQKRMNIISLQKLGYTIEVIADETMKNNQFVLLQNVE